MAKKDGSTERERRGQIEQFLKSKDLMTRLKAVEMLKELGDKEKLLSLLYSESWHVREKAAQALVEFGSEIRKKVEPMLDEGYWYVRAAAAYVIGEVGDASVLPKLKKMLSETNETVRGEVARAIAKMIKRDRKVLDELEVDEKLKLESTLKALKEFSLLEVIKGHEGSAE
ncbi:MAG: hypothetical protein DRQ06_01590 [Candidatus Hydrothermota bacterium]|uniref:HEAT repeat domain-containing protein n=1 Tax=candidate division WOR-3 bacterium TaxID=2052148 RepID=A0A7C1BGY3_UNCW3|nr:MAG: hypothetical protein DRQ06_01590 [Candidatus Hydrothermae bacterium]RKZ03160.1 MAG: hypothetical protein DRQ04_02790 [Candidatus Hydrothermae bacterium]HDM90928.1 HEAT repeat domain-containing protein [candidate division WOR-3 bacterium]